MSVHGLCAILAAAACAARAFAALPRSARTQCTEEPLDTSRRLVVLPAAVFAAGLTPQPASAIEVDLPDRINSDPYELIGMANPEDTKADKQEFYMKKTYKEDTYQLMKHMKIS